MSFKNSINHALAMINLAFDACISIRHRGPICLKLSATRRESSLVANNFTMTATNHPILSAIIVSSIVLFIWVGGRGVPGGRDGRGGQPPDETNDDVSAHALLRRGGSEPTWKGWNSTTTVKSMTTIRAWMPDGSIGLVEVPADPTSTQSLTLSKPTTTTTVKDKGWIPILDTSAIPTMTVQPTLTEVPPTATLTPTLAPTPTISPGMKTIRLTLKFEDGTPLPDGAYLETPGIWAEVRGGQGVASEFGLSPGTYRLTVTDTGLYQILEPPLIVPSGLASLIERTYTVPAVILRGSIKGTSGEPIPGAILTAVVCPTWNVQCPFGGARFAAVAGANGIFRARVSRGTFSNLIASPNTNNTVYSKTPLSDRVISTDVNIPITLRKGFTVSGRVRRGDGITAAESSGASIDLRFVSETYQGDTAYLPYDLYDIEWFVVRVNADGTFRTMLPAGGYSVEIIENGGGILGPRTELVIPRLQVTKNTVIGPFVLRYGKLRIRIVDGATGKPPTSGELTLHAIDRWLNGNLAYVAPKPGWNGFVGTLVSGPGSMYLDVTGDKPWIHPCPELTAKIVAGKTTTVICWIPATRRIFGTVRSSTGSVINTLGSSLLAAQRTSEKDGFNPYCSEIQANGNYRIAAPPGSYQISLVLSSLTGGWMSYYYAGLQLPLRRSVPLGAINDTKTDLTIPSYSLELVTVDGDGKLLNISGTFSAFYVLSDGNSTAAMRSISEWDLGRSKMMALAGRYWGASFTALTNLDNAAAYTPVMIPDFKLDKDVTITVVLKRPKQAILWGTILLASGLPCKSCEFEATTSGLSFTARTGRTGKFWLEVRAGSAYNFSANARLGVGATDPSIYQLDLGRNVTISKSTALVFHLPRPVSYRGIVVDSKGKAVPNAWIRISGANGMNFEATSTMDGRFKFTGLPKFAFPEARVVVLVLNPANQIMYSVDCGQRRITPGTTDRIVIPPLVRLSVQISSPYPMKGLRLRAFNDYDRIGPYDQKVYRPAVNSAFDLPAGHDYNVLGDLTTTTSRCTNIELLSNFTAKPGTTHRRDIKVPLVLWKGTVTSSSKKPLAGYIVQGAPNGWYRSENGTCLSAAVTDSTGSFRFPVIAGSYFLTISGPFGNPWSPVVIGNQNVGASGLVASYVYSH